MQLDVINYFKGGRLEGALFQTDRHLTTGYSLYQSGYNDAEGSKSETEKKAI